jgi:hypothetical protein
MSCKNCLEWDRLWMVHAYRGTESPRRVFGRDLTKSKALDRARLVGRLFPEMADARVTPSVG